MQSAVLDNNGDAVFTIDAKQALSDAVATDEMSETFKKAIESDADLVQVMKDSNTKLIIRVNCSDDTVEFTYEATDL
jgi:predicted glycosyltransferase involved in capsule biosynthesis